MIKRYLLDVLCIALVAAVAPLAAQKPMIDLNLRSSAGDRGNLGGAKKEETEMAPKGVIIRDVAVLRALKERNIFAAAESYARSKSEMQGLLSKGPYALIGVLQGEEKKAVFREQTGSIVTLTVGKKLIDGSVITRIEDRSVEVMKGEEKKELRIFKVKVPTLSTGKKRE